MRQRSNSATPSHIIKGVPCDTWDQVQAIQHEPFIYIMGNGSKWAGEEEDDVSVLLDMLAKETLDPRFEYREPYFWTVDPCGAVYNPDWTYDNGLERYIDGPRLYECNGVVRFFGNFLTYSHGFNIDTNHQPTIDALIAAIEANMATEAYQAARPKPKTAPKIKPAKAQAELFA